MKLAEVGDLSFNQNSPKSRKIHPENRCGFINPWLKIFHSTLRDLVENFLLTMGFFSCGILLRAVGIHAPKILLITTAAVCCQKVSYLPSSFLHIFEAWYFSWLTADWRHWWYYCQKPQRPESIFQHNFHIDCCAGAVDDVGWNELYPWSQFFWELYCTWCAIFLIVYCLKRFFSPSR